MTVKQRHEFKNKKEMKGWVNMSGNTHLESPSDIFAFPIEWGLFVWNKENIYHSEWAISLHGKKVTHQNLVCRPTKYK